MGTISAGSSSAFSKTASPSANRVLAIKEPSDRRQDLLHSPQTQAVNLAGSFALAQSDHQHLEHAGLVRCAKVGMRLDPVDQHDTVGLMSVAIKIDR